MADGLSTFVLKYSSSMNYKSFSNQEIVDMDNRYRIQLINSIGGFKSICLIGTQNDEGQNNLGIFNSVFHIGSAPALYGFCCRPADRERHTLENIMETGVYTMNQVDESFYKQAHQASAKYPRELSEFDQVGLTPQFEHDIKAPFVQEAKIKFALELEDDLLLSNKNTLVIGKVMHVLVREDLIDEKGYLDLAAANTITGSGCDAYYTTDALGRMPYARPENTDKK